MIALPFNDYKCLASISEVISEMTETRDPVLVELAGNHKNTKSLVEYIRNLPQRDDDGESEDGPKVESCSPPQRLRIPAPDPNCVERAALYLAAAELIDPRPVRQLATLDTPVGLHTFPVENGAPVILDPRVPRNCINAGLALANDGPIEVEPLDAIEWTANFAETGARNVRNGPSKVRRARNAVMRLVGEQVVPSQSEVDAIGWMFALAERAAHRWGARAVALVKTTALAIAEVADEVLARNQLRNDYASQLGSAIGRFGADLGGVALRSQLQRLGIGDDVIGLAERDFNREGLTLGTVARPPRLPTFANTTRRAA